MKNFDDFQQMLHDNKVSADIVNRCDLFCNGKEMTETEKQVACTQVATIELLRRYHEWVNS